MAKKILEKFKEPTVITKNKKKFRRILFFTAAVYITFFDPYSLCQRYVINAGQINELKKEISKYEDDIEKSKTRYHELHSDKADLEKYAREQFLMKKKNEDIFLIK